VKYADDLVLLAKEEMVLQGTVDRLVEIRRFCGLEMIVEKTKVMRISRQPSAIQIMVDQNDPENAEFFNCSGSVITDGARWTRGINP
jgi:hypothetical protein